MRERDETDYCEPCGVYHVNDTHEVAVPSPCGALAFQGFDVVLECARPPHMDPTHTTRIGQRWEAPNV